MNIIKPNTNFDFMGTKYVWLTISGILVLASIVLLLTRGLNFGIDFTGGIEMQVSFTDHTVDSQAVRELVKNIKSDDIQVQKFGDVEHNEYLIRVKGTEETLNNMSREIEKALAAKYAEGQYEIRKLDMVGPRVGEELKMSGVYALVWALIGILIYVAIRFDYKFSPGAIVALIHDILITVGFFSLIQYQFTLSTVAALLTVVGYSVNDTIVIYDRIRENFGKLKGTPLSNIINKSVNETLSRTILTTLVTMLAVGALLFLGGATLRDFSLALTVGMISGVYSTIFIASPIMLFMDNFVEKRTAKKLAKANR